jgi:hypothetical protein
MRLSAPVMSAFLAALAFAAAAQTPDSGRFDGDWDVTLSCPASQDGAQPFSYAFTAQVRGSGLHGEYGEAGQPGSMSLDGRIRSDGSASLEARGLTGRTEFNVHQTSRGVPYQHPVTAHFDGARGEGQWVTTRVCPFAFSRR